MFRFSKKVLFNIEAVLDIAYHAGAEPMRCKEITRRQGIPRRHLEQAPRQLVRPGILIDVRGSLCGYRLARERRGIFIGDIVSMVQKATSGGSELFNKVARLTRTEMQNMVIICLNELFISDLCGKADMADFIKENRKALNIAI